jgi:hypothetical protein
VLVAQSADASPGMRRSSQRIVDALAAAGVTVRSAAEIERAKDAHGSGTRRLSRPMT